MTSGSVDSAPVFSPDGLRIAFRRFSELWTMNADAVLPSADNQIAVVNSDGSGAATAVAGTDRTESADWGPLAPIPPACKLRVSRARFFVFRKQKVYRLVARYPSPVEDEVTVRFFEAKAGGGKGRSLGTLQRNFRKQGRFRIRVRTGEPMIRNLRRSGNGFIAELKIKKRDGYCARELNLRLSRLRMVQRQFVWFLDD